MATATNLTTTKTNVATATAATSIAETMASATDNLLDDVISPITESLFGFDYADLKYALKVAACLGVLVVLVRLFRFFAPSSPRAVLLERRRPRGGGGGYA